jgi:hypothetical protein
MSPTDAAKLFREKADAYLDMTAYARDERGRRLLHELFEENQAKAELLEQMVHSHEGFEAFLVRSRLNWFDAMFALPAAHFHRSKQWSHSADGGYRDRKCFL